MIANEIQLDAPSETVDGLQTFLRHLRDSKLLDDRQLEEVVRQCGPGADASGVSKALIDKELLTRFQFARIAGGRASQLVMGKYHLLDELGRGSFGRVFKAKHTVMNRLVALKVITPELLTDTQIRSWFRREVLAATRLQHPNIVMAFDADEIDHNLFLAMEYVDGPTLETVVDEEGPLEIHRAMTMMHQTALALQHAHEQGMVHRDIKPANLLLPRQGPSANKGVVVKVVDFGLARLYPKTSPQNQTLDKETGFVGTPCFMSPEQAHDLHDVDIRSDLYSLGCTYYYALTGSAPFSGRTLVEILAKHLAGDAKPLEHFRPEIPPGFAAVVRRLMERKPEKRFQTPEELASELSYLLAPGSNWAHQAQPAKEIAEPTTSENVSFEGDPQLEFVQSALMQSDYRATHVSNLVSLETNLPNCAVPQETASSANAGSTKPSAQVDTASVCHMETERTGDPAALRDVWRQWFAIVQRLAAGEKLRLDTNSYRHLHRELLQAAKALAKSQDSPVKCLAERVETVVEPWLTPQTLCSLDRSTCAALHRTCQDLDKALGGSKKANRFGPAIAAFVALCAILALEFLVVGSPMRLISSSAAQRDQFWRGNFIGLAAGTGLAFVVSLVIFIATKRRSERRA
ncbi:MAG TPA: protein kinase [Gemmataceae bacterium]|nr:protein kinase [Gemmataceae bacterium]